MAKEQQVIDAFFKVDTDHDGEINFEQFGEILNQLELLNIYPGSVKKTIRKINYQNPDRETLNLEQTKEYINSLETPAKHDIWKKKLELLEVASEVKKTMHGEEKSESGAAPGAPATVPSKHPDKTLQEANIRVLVGPDKPNYSAMIEFEVDKADNGSKVKPFIKLTFGYKNHEDAKQMQQVFKSNFEQFLKLLAEDISEWTDQMNNFKINSIVQGSNVTFFITTANEEMVSLIQMFSEMLEMSFQTQVQGRAHFRYEFQYDFQNFIKEENSSFYDCFVTESRLTINTRAKNIFRQLRNFFQKTCQVGTYNDLIEALIPVIFFHLDSIEADIEFDSFKKESQYELETKEEIQDILNDIAQFLNKLEGGGMTPKKLLKLLNCDIQVDASVGEWKAKVVLKLPNLNRIFEESFKKYQEKQSSEEPCEQASPQLCQYIQCPQPKKINIKKTDSSGNIIYSSDSDSEG